MKRTYTPNQEEVISLDAGYNMVLAGPGCGKTDILAERIARACESGKVSPDNILCLTFTNRATRGMYDRVRLKLGQDIGNIFIGNIHRYCSRFLFENAVLSSETAIVDQDDQKDIIETELQDQDLKALAGIELKSGGVYAVNRDRVCGLLGIYGKPDKTVPSSTANKILESTREKIVKMEHLMSQVRDGHPRNLLIYGSLLDTDGMKAEFPFFDDFRQACNEVSYDPATFQTLSPARQFMALAVKLREYKRTSSLVDFDDLLIRTFTEYKSDTDGKYRRYSWVQVDEVQDMSPFQIALIDLFIDSSSDPVVLYLGDEQQAIFSFMGATMETLNNLKVRCGTNIFRLDKNFRSPKYLLDIYNEYAVKELGVDRDFLPEPKDSAVQQKNDVCLQIYDTEEKETRAVSTRLVPFLQKPKPGQEEPRTAVLLNLNKYVDEVSRCMEEAGIAHFKISDRDIFTKDLMKLTLANLSAVTNDFNVMAWSKLMYRANAVETLMEGRHLYRQMREVAAGPSDLLREDMSTYLSEFCRHFDKEEIVLFDTETTGTDVFNDDIVQIAAVKVKDGSIVKGSEFNIFLQTGKEIPAKLGALVNPMVTEYEKAVKVPRAEGLREFMSYAGGLPLMGHNVQFDYNILKNNLTRDCTGEYGTLSATIIDTLHIAHLLYPRLARYKLAHLIEVLHLSGANSHMAEEDIMATYELAKHSRGEAEKYLSKQRVFLAGSAARKAKAALEKNYKELYLHTRDSLYVLKEGGCALTDEMRYIRDYLKNAWAVSDIDRFDSILEFLEADIISPSEPNALVTHLSNHLGDITTLKEADLCGSSTFKEKVFVSTIHKAKGLEFENVIVMKAHSGNYPASYHKYSKQQIEEDKRLFYVAISRAMKRLIVTYGKKYYSDTATPFITNVLRHFTVRGMFVCGSYAQARVKVSITEDTLSITYEQDERKSSYEYGPLFPYFAKKSGNQMDLFNELKDICRQSDPVEKINKLMMSYGIPLIE